MNNDKSWESWKSEVRRRNRMMALKRQLFADAVTIGDFDENYREEHGQGLRLSTDGLDRQKV